MTTEKSITQQMRDNLAPKGTADLCHIFMRCGHFEKDFIWKCIDELERMPMRAAVGDTPTNLEKLAYELLMESSYLTDSTRVSVCP